MSPAQLEKMIPTRSVIGGRMYHLLMNRLPPCEIRSRRMFDVYSRVIQALAHDYANDVFKSTEKRAIETYMGTVGHFIDEYARKLFPRTPITPEEMLEFFMEQHDLNQSDLQHELGTQSVVSSVLSGTRKLNRGQIERLAKRFHVSPGTFYSEAA